MKEEFLQAIDEHQGIILKVCRMYCSDNSDAEDLYQDILLALWKAWPKFRRDAKISTWMYRVGLNQAISRLRNSKRNVPRESLNFVHDTIPANEQNRLDIQFDKELQTAIAALGRFDRALLMLYLDEKTYREIAEILGVSESNVGVKINRIKKQLKEKIKP